MHFCIKCNNMYYIRISSDDSNKLIYYCRNCGNENTNLNSDNFCVSKVQINHSEQSYTHTVNKYTKFDPTLPRIKNIKCPNEACISHEKDSNKEVIYLRYDNINMKYVYLCSNCDTMWKTAEEK